MNRVLISLLLCLLTANVSFSQSTYPKLIGDSLIVITKEQLQQTNKIFVEHQKLLITDSLLRHQITDLNHIININDSINSIKNEQIELYISKINNDDKYINQLLKNNKKLSIKSKVKSWIIIGSIITLISTIL